MGCFSSKPTVPGQPLTATASKTPAAPISTIPQHLPKTQNIPEPTPTQTLQTRSIPASNPSLPTRPSPPNQHSAAKDPTSAHSLHTARETSIAPKTPAAPHVSTKPLHHDTHIPSTSAIPVSPAPPVLASSNTDQLDQRNHVLDTEQQPSSPDHIVTAKQANIVLHHAKSALVTTDSVPSQLKADDSNANPHEERNALAQSTIATSPLIPEKKSPPVSANLDSITAVSTEQSLTTPTLGSHQHDDIVPVSDHVSPQPLPVTLEKTEPDPGQNANSVVAVQEKLQMEDHTLVPEADPSLEQYSAVEESEASHHLNTVDEANIEPHSTIASDPPTQPLQDCMLAQSNLANATPLIPGNNTELHEDLANTSESDMQIPFVTSEEDLTTGEYDTTATTGNVGASDPKHTPVTDGPKVDGSIVAPREQLHVHSSIEERDTLAQASSAITQPMPSASENTDSNLEESPRPAVNRHDSFTSSKSEQSSASSTSPCQKHDLDATPDTQVNHVSTDAAEIAMLPVDIQFHTSPPVELEETQRVSARYSTPIVAPQNTSHLHDRDLIPVVDPTTEQNSVPEQLPAPHNPSAPDFPTPPPQDSIPAQSSPTVLGPTLGSTDEPSQQNYPILFEEEEPTVGLHDINSKSTYVVPDDIKPAVAADVSLESQPDVDSSATTPYEQPAVCISREEVIISPQPSIARTAGTSVESGNTISKTSEENSHPVVTHLDRLTTASPEQSSNAAPSHSIVPPAVDGNSSNSETSALTFGKGETRTLPQVSSDRTLSNLEDTTSSHVAEEGENVTAQTKTFDENDVTYGTRTPSTTEEDMESAASTTGIDSHGTRTPSTDEEDIELSDMESSASTSRIDSPSVRTSSTFMEGMQYSSSRWDYRTPYRGGCDGWVMNNPPHGVGYYSFKNYNGNIGTNLPRGAYHYQNIGTDGGFYIKNSDGSSYHYSPSRGGTYREPYY